MRKITQKIIERGKQIESQRRLDLAYKYNLDQGTPIFFSEIAPAYITSVISNRSAELRSQITYLADDISLSSQLIYAIPIHAKEALNIVEFFSNMKLLCKTGAHVVLFINGCKADDIEAGQKLYQSLKDNIGQLDRHIDIVSLFFDQRQTIGTVRGVLTDSVIVASMRAKFNDPILISYDCDNEYFPTNRNETILKHFENPKIDAVTGPLFYGYNNEGKVFSSEKLNAPELMLENRMFHVRRSMMVKGLITSDVFFSTEGPNSAFRMASLCAAGGYDYSLSSAEDDRLGLAIYLSRRSDQIAFPSDAHHVFAEELLLATNCRRAFDAVTNGLTIRDSWDSFVSAFGHSLNVSSICERYKSSLKFLQMADLLDFEENSPKLHDRLNARTIQFSDEIAMTQFELETFWSQLGFKPGEKKISEHLHTALKNVAHEEVVGIE